MEEMKMSGMVERMARAMFMRSVYQGYDDATLRSEWRRMAPSCRDAARAALQAMREPTEHQLNSGACYEDPSELYKPEVDLGIRGEGDIAGDVWRAMVDAALSEPQP